MREAKANLMSWVRSVTVGVLIALLLAGTSFLPRPKLERSEFTPSIQIRQRLTGEEATKLLEAHLAKNPALAKARREQKMKLGHLRADENQMVVISYGTSKPITKVSITTWIGQKLGVSARQIEEPIDGGLLVITPFESDSDDMTAEFHSWYVHYEAGIQYAANVKLRTDDPENTIDLWDDSVACDIKPTESDFAAFFSPVVNAQHGYYGANCNNASAVNARFKSVHANAVKNGVLAAGGAAIPCVGATLGWVACVGGAFAGAYVIGMFYAGAEHLWDCRCVYMNMDCDKGEPPPM